MAVSKEQRAVGDMLAAVYDDWSEYGLGRETDVLVKKNKFAYIVGVMLDGGNTTAEQAWRGMLLMKKRLDLQDIALTPAAIADLPLETLKAILAEKPCVHHYHKKMAQYVKLAARKIMDEYDGDADSLFDAYTAREVFYRLLEFRGIGDKKAAMAMRFLIDELEEVDRYRSISFDLPVDAQVVRVFTRTGLVDTGATRCMVRRKAVELFSDVPWKLDSAWHIGFTWCRADVAWCRGDPQSDGDSYSPCPLEKVCPKIGVTPK